MTDLDESKVGSTVLVRARLHNNRETGKVLFVTLRQGIATVQAIILKQSAPDFFKWAAGLPRESVLDVTGTVTAVEKRVESVTQGSVELQLATAFIVSKALPVLPFNLEDASRPDAVVEAREAEIKAAEAAGADAASIPPRFGELCTLCSKLPIMRYALTPQNQPFTHHTSLSCSPLDPSVSSPY